MINISKLRSHGVILGQTQSGKTTLALKLLNAQQGLKIFVNTKQEAWVKKRFKFQIESPEHMHLIYENYSDYEPFLLLIEPSVTKREATDEISEIFDICLQYHQKHPNKFRTTIMIDEIQVFQSKFSRNESFARIFTMGLGLGLIGVAIAQRPQLINNDILYNSEEFVLMYTTYADLIYLKERGIIDDIELLSFDRKFDAYIQKNKREGIKRLDNR